MDAEHRHELKENDLIKWLKGYPEALKKDLWTQIGTAIIVLVILYWIGKPIYSNFFLKSRIAQRIETTGLYSSIQGQKMQAMQAAAQNVAASDSLLSLANKLEMSANKASSGNVSALAYIKRGDLLRADLHYKAEPVEEAVMLEQVEKARQAYQNALDRAGDNDLLKAGATFGLAICAEQSGQFDKARELYTRLSESEEFAGTTYAAEARNRLETMADYEQDYKLAKYTPPAGGEDIEGLIQSPGSPEIKLPSSLEEGAKVETFDNNPDAAAPAAEQGQ